MVIVLSIWTTRGLREEARKNRQRQPGHHPLPLSVRAAWIFSPSLELSFVICRIDVKETTAFQAPPWSLLVAGAPQLGFLQQSWSACLNVIRNKGAEPVSAGGADLMYVTNIHYRCLPLPFLGPPRYHHQATGAGPSLANPRSPSSSQSDGCWTCDLSWTDQGASLGLYMDAKRETVSFPWGH